MRAQDYFYWEMLELMRKMFLIGVVSIVYPGSVLQLFIAICLCILFLSMCAWKKPFKNDEDNIEKTQSEMVLLYIYVM